MKKLWLGAVFFVLSVPVQASRIYEYNAPCLIDCSVVGLVAGQPGGGTIEFDGTNFAPGATLDASDIIEFDLTFGTVSITKSTAAGLFFAGQLAGDGTSFLFFDLVTSTALGLALGDFIDITNELVIATPLGSCDDNSCQNATLAETALFSGGTLTLTDVPEPGTILLVVLGLAGLACRRRG